MQKKKLDSVPMVFLSVVIRVRGFDVRIVSYLKKPYIANWRIAKTRLWRSDVGSLPLCAKTKEDVLRRAYVALFKLNVPEVP